MIGEICLDRVSYWANLKLARLSPDVQQRGGIYLIDHFILSPLFKTQGIGTIRQIRRHLKAIDRPRLIEGRVALAIRSN